MSDWQTVKLSNGKTYGGLSGKSGKDFINGDTPFVTFLEVLNNVKLTKMPTAKFLARPGETQNEVRENDVLLNGSSETPEEVAIPSSVNFKPKTPVYLNSFCFGYRPNTNEINADFFSYFLRSNTGRKIITKLAAGSTRYNISKKAFMSLELVIPSVEEQKQIANVLSDIDEEIMMLYRKMKKNRLVKMAVMQQLLTGKKRLPGFSGEWKIKKLGDIADMNSGGTPSSKIKSYYDGHLLWASITDMTSVGRYISNTEKKLTDLGLASSSARIFPENTILYAMYASIGECCIALQPITTSQAILGIRCSKQIDNIFLYYYLTSIKDRVKLLGQQGTQTNLNKGMVKNFELYLPQPEEQIAIATVLCDMDTNIESLGKIISKKKLIKTSIMQQLLTGKTRLVVANV